MRRCFSLFLFFFLLILPVSATENNDFFNLHSDECVYDGREYRLNDPAGYLTVWDAPGGKAQHYLFNEQSMIVFALYTDPTGSQWAQLRYSEPLRGFALSGVDEQYIGWASFSSFYRQPDVIDFLALYADSFVERPLRLRLTDYPDTTVWVHPGAERNCGYLRWFISDEDALLSFPSWWKDSEGKRWALWGNHFVCLDDPERTSGVDMGLHTVFYPAVSAEELPFVVEQIEPSEPPSPLPYILLAVAFVLLALAFVLRKFTNTQTERK